MKKRKIGSIHVSIIGVGCNNFSWRINVDETRSWWRRNSGEKWATDLKGQVPTTFPRRLMRVSSAWVWITSISISSTSPSPRRRSPKPSVLSMNW